MLNLFKNRTKNIRSVAIGVFTTLNMLVPNNKQQDIKNYATSKDNKDAIEHFFEVNDAREALAKIDVDAEIDKRVDWFQDNILKKIYEEDIIVKDFENKVRKAKSKKLSKILDYKKDRYITQQYLDKVNLERKINHKEPYCLGFIMHNMMKFDELNDVFDKFPGVAKLSNKYFINQAKMTCKDYLHDSKKEKVKPEVGDIIVLKRANGSHHAVTYIGENLTFSANGNDHGGRSELKKVRINYWKRQATNFYIFKSKDVVKEYWQEKYKNTEKSKLEFLAELYKDRELPKEIAIMMKQEKDDKNPYINDLIASNNNNVKSSAETSKKSVDDIKFVKSNDIPSYASVDALVSGKSKIKSSKSLLAKRKNKNNRSNNSNFEDNRVVINDNRRKIISLKSQKAKALVKLVNNENVIKQPENDVKIANRKNVQTAQSLLSIRKNKGQRANLLNLRNNSRG